MIKRIATAAVYLENQDSALAFWTETMGFEKRAEIDMGNGYRWLEVAPKGAESCLVIYPKKLMKDWNERKPSIVFFCDNIETYCTHLRQKSVRFKDELKQMQWGKFAIFTDTDRTEFVLKG